MRILFLTHRLPYAPNRGDRMRAFHMLHHLREHADVELVSLVHDDEEASHIETVRAFIPDVTMLPVTKFRNYLRGAALLAGRTPLTHALLDAPGMESVLERIRASRRPDVVFAYCSGMARFAMHGPLADVPMILDFVDVDSRKWQDLAEVTPPPLSWIYRREAKTLGAFEQRAARSAAAALVVNEREAENARALAPDANVRVVPNGVDVDRLRPLTPPAAGARVVFCGVMNYAPNEEGIAWFVREVWPLVRQARSDATLAIVGADPTASVIKLAADPSIHVTGRVPDVRDWLWSSAVAIAPLRVARGIQNKALEAIAAGLPIVMTEAVAAGLPPQAAPASSVANTPERFAERILTLLAMTPEARRAHAATADLSALTWQRTLSPLLPLIERAARESKRPTTLSATVVPIRI